MHLKNRLSQEYIVVVNSFIEVAKKCVDQNSQVRCPCRKCQKKNFQPLDVVEDHLYRPCISFSYQRCVFHGEDYDQVPVVDQM